MKRKAKSSRTDELRRQYKRSDFPKGFVRGRYAARLAAGSNIVCLDTETGSASSPATSERKPTS
jgi:hypothetical protein